MKSLTANGTSLVNRISLEGPNIRRRIFLYEFYLNTFFFVTNTKHISEEYETYEFPVTE